MHEGQRSDDPPYGGTGSGGDGPPPWDDEALVGPGDADVADSAYIRSPVVRGDQIDIGEPPYPYLDLIHPEPGAMTVLFGDGSAGKGTLAAWIVARATAQGDTVLIYDAEGHPREWARRIAGFGGVMRRWIHWSHPIGLPQDYDGKVDLVVLDSAAYFTVGDDAMMGSEGATRLQAALAAKRTPALVIAHVSKGIDTDKPYGSVFWHNAARVTLRLSEVEGRRQLKCFKATDLVGLHKGDTWDVAVDYDEDSITPRGLDLLRPDRMTFTSPLTRIVDEVLSDGEQHEILDFTLHGHSATGYRLLLDNDPTITRGTVPSLKGGRSKVTWQRVP